MAGLVRHCACDSVDGDVRSVELRCQDERGD